MNYLETIKNITKDKKRRTENLILLVVLLVVILIAINYIFTDDNSNSTNTSPNIINNKEANGDINKVDNSLEEKLEIILSQISGISDVSVVLSYSKDTTQNVVYNTTEEQNENGKTLEKQVAYNEQGGNKTAIVESINMPVVEGAIVVAKGASSVDIKSRIASAISSVTNLPVYKVQVFEKGE